MVVDVGRAGSVVLPPERGERLEALTDAWVTAMTEHGRAALLRLPSAAAALAGALEASVRAGRESLAQFGNVRRSDRLRDKLLQLAREHGRVDSFGVRLDLPLTHELLGEMVGASRETVTWAFAELAREGFVRRDGRLYRLAVSPDELAS
jgi:CRP/FNR family transcriptional regulator